MVQLVPQAGRAFIVLWQAVRATKGVKTIGGPVGLPFGFNLGGAGGLISKLLGLLGGIQIIDWLLPMVGNDQDAAEKLEIFLGCLDDMEQLGIIHEYTPSRRFAQNGETDPGPTFLIMNLEKGQGFYTNFHMSRSGLKAHDDKQDTFKRPRTTRRRNWNSKK